MDTREKEILVKLLARADPPPILHRYRRPSEWTLDEINKQQIFACAPDDLNDPFECSAPVSWNFELMKQRFLEEFAPARGLSPIDAAKELESLTEEQSTEMLRAGLARIRSQSGIICLSTVPNSIRMWSYYAQSHEGICIGFDTKMGPFMAAMQVLYQNPETPLDVINTLKRDPSELAAHITLRKAAEWEFEQEYRIPVGMIEDHPRLIPFHPRAITEIRLGARIKDDFKKS